MRIAVCAIGQYAFTNQKSIEEIISIMPVDKVLPLVKYYLTEEDKQKIEASVEKKERRAAGKGKKKNRQQKLEEREQKKKQLEADLEDTQNGPRNRKDNKQSNRGRKK